MPKSVAKPTSHTSRTLGYAGESLALAYLQTIQRHVLVTRNYRCVFGEIDLITLKDHTLHFVEVKTRTTQAFGPPHTAVTAAKLRKLTHSARHFIHSRRRFRSGYLYQLDLVGVVIAASGTPIIKFHPQINWV